MHRKVIYNSNIDEISKPISIHSSYQELLLWKDKEERIIVIFDLRGQRGYIEITSLQDYNWYLESIRHDGRTSEKFFWFVNQMYLDMNRS